MKIYRNIILPILVFIILWLGCSRGQTTLVNTSHLDYLYQEATMSGKQVGFIYIYSNYPDYRRIGAPGEGIACVDDAARAAVFYLRHHQATGNRKSLEKAKKLLSFLEFMQSSNGYFYNFIFQDYRVNKNYQRSQAKGDWWSWRAIWAMGETAEFFIRKNSEYSLHLIDRIQKTIENLDSFLKNYPSKTAYAGFELPSWLPYQYSGDQAAALIQGLIPYYTVSKDTTILPIISRLSEGLITMQIGDSATFPYGAFLSWRNLWHAWGNSQAEALFRAGNLLDKKTFIRAAIRETQFFHPYLIEQNYLKRFELKKETDSLAVVNIRRFEQIAYGIRPLVMANLRAYRMSGESLFAKQAATIGSWLLGENVAGVAMYDPQTGRCYDGIDSANTINRNSGAESTIEALLTLLALEQNPVTRQFIHDYYFNKH